MQKLTEFPKIIQLIKSDHSQTLILDYKSTITIELCTNNLLLSKQDRKIGKQMNENKRRLN